MLKSRGIVSGVCGGTTLGTEPDPGPHPLPWESLHLYSSLLLPLPSHLALVSSLSLQVSQYLLYIIIKPRF